MTLESEIIELEINKKEVVSQKQLSLFEVKRNGLNLRHVDHTLRDDVEIVEEAIRQNGMAIQYAGDDHRRSYEMGMLAVRQNGMALQYLDIDTSCRKKITLEAVEHNGMALKYADLELRSSHAVCMAAIKQNGLAYKYVPQCLRNNLELAFAAIENKGSAYCYFSDEMKLGKVAGQKMNTGLAMYFAKNAVLNSYRDFRIHQADMISKGRLIEDEKNNINQVFDCVPDLLWKEKEFVEDIIQVLCFVNESKRGPYVSIPAFLNHDKELAKIWFRAANKCHSSYNHDAILRWIYPSILMEKDVLKAAQITTTADAEKAMEKAVASKPDYMMNNRIVDYDDRKLKPSSKAVSF